MSAYLGFGLLAAVARVVYLAFKVNREIRRREADRDEIDPGPVEMTQMEGMPDMLLYNITTAVALSVASKAAAG